MNFKIKTEYDIFSRMEPSGMRTEDVYGNSSVLRNDFLRRDTSRLSLISPGDENRRRLHQNFLAASTRFDGEENVSFSGRKGKKML